MRWFGDNGIISNAQQANVKTGMAALEEWLQEKYVEYYDEDNNYGNKQEILANKIPGLFLKDGVRNYVISDSKVYYLINKNKLPNEIKKGLINGDTTEYSKYTRLIDVYGVTDDLKVFYYNSENQTLYGNLEASNIDLEKIGASSINSDPNMKEFITKQLAEYGEIVGENGVTISNTNVLRDLKIDGVEDGITSLVGLQDLKNLRILTLSNMTLSSLKGVEGCPSLYYIYLKNCNITDYSALCSVIKLQYLYLYFPSAQMSESVANGQISNLGNGLAGASELSHFEYFGVSGDTKYFEATSNAFSYSDPNDNGSKYRYFTNNRSNLTDISPLALLHSTIKSNMKYLYIWANNISSVNCIADFSGLIEVAVQLNTNLNSLNGLGNHPSLEKLNAQYCNIGDISSLAGNSGLTFLNINHNLVKSLVGIEASTELVYFIGSDNDLINVEALANKLKLTYLDLKNNSNLESVLNLGSCRKINKLYLLGCTNMIKTEFRDAFTVAPVDLEGEISIIEQCGSNYSIPSDFMIYVQGVAKSLDLSYTAINKYLTSESDEFSVLKGRKNVNKLNLSGQTSLTDKDLQDVLSTMTGLEYLSLVGVNLDSLDFISNLTSLIEIDLRDVTFKKETNGKVDLSEINGNVDTIDSFAITDVNVDLTKIESAINTIMINAYRSYGKRDSWIATSWYSFQGFIAYGEGFNWASTTTLTYYKSGPQGFYGDEKQATVDLSNNTGLVYFELGYDNRDYILPSSVEKVYVRVKNNKLNLSRCSNLEFFQSTAMSVDVGLNTLPQKNKLTSLELYCYKQKDLSILSTFPSSNLKYLNVCGWGIGSDPNYGSYSEIESLSGIENCPNLKTLWLKCTRVKDISKLSSLTDLQEVSILACQNLTSLNGLQNCSNLTYLYLEWTDVNDINALKDCNNLAYVTIMNNKISNIRVLEGKLKIQDTVTSSETNYGVRLSNNNITDLSPLLNCIKYNGENDSFGTISFSRLILKNNNISATVSATNSNVDTLLKLYEAGLRYVDLTGNNFSKGQADRLIEKYGSGLVIDYID